MASQRDLVRAVWRTWGGPGLARRARYEASRRTGALRLAERRWPGAPPPGARVRRIGLGDAVRAASGATGTPDDRYDRTIELYGSLPVEVDGPPDWHLHPLTGHRYDGDAHWSELSDHDPTAGDIKDVWELSRMGWLQADLRRWAATGDDQVAADVWSVLEDWYRTNPRYLGPNWMCGQETSLRTIGVLVATDVLDPSDATTDRHRDLVAAMLHDAVGRVAPTLGYAMSQRNNHATSEAGFLWGAAVLAPWLPDADRLQAKAAAALTEAVRDQFGADGSYAQHSPTYQRVALHVLLWCAAIARATGVALPAGIDGALAASVVHLSSLLVPNSGGRMPNLGGNDGALVVDLAGSGVWDFRPVLAHAAAAVGVASPLGPGPWDLEAEWFGAPGGTAPLPTVAPSRATHALGRGPVHAVLRAGPLGHRPAHADQLHLDVWLDGQPVAIDPGSYRYTAPAPWGNALAGEEVHNLPRRPGSPQAVRSGRFFWRSWHEAHLRERVDEPHVVAQSARLDLPYGATVARSVVVTDRMVVVVDRGDPPLQVRWNLPVGAHVRGDGGAVAVLGEGWSAVVSHEGSAQVLEPADDDPRSGWQAPTYGIRERCVPVVVDGRGSGVVVSVFALGSPIESLAPVVAAARLLAVDRLDRQAVEAVASAAAGHERAQ